MLCLFCLIVYKLEGGYPVLQGQWLGVPSHQRDTKVTQRLALGWGWGCDVCCFGFTPKSKSSTCFVPPPLASWFETALPGNPSVYPSPVWALLSTLCSLSSGCFSCLLNLESQNPFALKQEFMDIPEGAEDLILKGSWCWDGQEFVSPLFTNL